VTARSEVLDAARSLAARAADGTFTPDEVVRELRRRGSTYAESTIRTHVVSRMCVDANDNHGVTYDDLERAGDDRYRLRRG
jgi:hypothetical protein